MVGWQCECLALGLTLVVALLHKVAPAWLPAHVLLESESRLETSPTLCSCAKVSHRDAWTICNRHSGVRSAQPELFHVPRCLWY